MAAELKKKLPNETSASFEMDGVINAARERGTEGERGRECVCGSICRAFSFDLKHPKHVGWVGDVCARGDGARVRSCETTLAHRAPEEHRHLLWKPRTNAADAASTSGGRGRHRRYSSRRQHLHAAHDSSSIVESTNTSC